MQVGATEAGRRAEDIPIVLHIPVYVMEQGEPLASERMRKSVGASLQSSIGCYAAGYRPGIAPTYGARISDDEIPPELLPLVQEYRRIKVNVTGPARLDGPAWYATAFEGHVWRLHPGLLDLITEDVIRARAGVFGTADDVRNQVKQYESSGVNIFCPILYDSVDNVTTMLQRFGRGVIDGY
jgi:hypothetical protein